MLSQRTPYSVFQPKTADVKEGLGKSCQQEGFGDKTKDFVSQDIDRIRVVDTYSGSVGELVQQ